jgi:hypothetical protein
LKNVYLLAGESCKVHSPFDIHSSRAVPPYLQSVTPWNNTEVIAVWSRALTAPSTTAPTMNGSFPPSSKHFPPGPTCSKQHLPFWSSQTLKPTVSLYIIVGLPSTTLRLWSAEASCPPDACCLSLSPRLATKTHASRGKISL